VFHTKSSGTNSTPALTGRRVWFLPTHKIQPLKKPKELFPVNAQKNVS
jgi:hypothetical protein